MSSASVSKGSLSTNKSSPISKLPDLSSSLSDSEAKNLRAEIARLKAEKEIKDKEISLLKGAARGSSSIENENAILKLKLELEEKKKIGLAPRPSIFKDVTSVDMVFIIDCTGSMDSYIDAAKKQVQSIVSDIKRTYFNENKVRVAVVGYRDHDCDDSKAIEILDFEEDIKKVEEFLGNLEAFGGDDEAENVLGGLEAAKKIKLEK